MYPRVILRGILIKKSQQKRRTSPCNFKERIFVLNTEELVYSEPRAGKKPCEKGRPYTLHLICSQVVHDNYYLYLFAPDNDCRLKWVRALKEETKNNDLFLAYHPDFWSEGRWRCCQQTEKMAEGCNEYHPSLSSKKPLPPTPDPQRRFSDPGERVAVALKDFSPKEDRDLRLIKDEEYIVMDDSQPNWWTVRSFCNHFGEIYCWTFNSFSWYNKGTTRAEAEDLLLKENKEGAFIVRDSRHAGVYTVSVFTKAPGSNGEKNPRVKHYQIRQSPESGKFYLAEKYLFNTIPALIQYHQHNAAGLITRLRHCVFPGREDFILFCGFCLGKCDLHPEELELMEEVGSGQFGLVYQGKWNGQKVAVKTVREGAMSEEEFKDEAMVMKTLSHSKLVKLLGVCMQRKPICLVFEFMENGCLTDYLRGKRGTLSKDTLLGMCVDVSEGMVYLESNNYIHRDLAARNCLVSINMEVKVSDFGMARFVLDDQYTSSQGSKFPVKWSALEVIQYLKFSSKSDVWSFGVLMWEVYSEGRLPYETQTNQDVVQQLNDGMRLLRPRLAPDDVYQLMQWCWKEKPEDRPTFALLLHDLASLIDTK
uniref:Tyrosine-protein kinase n=1 Tax=Denticeps clupeoides TaxID=299321 RepID=A0A8C4C742_9TELE